LASHAGEAIFIRIKNQHSMKIINTTYIILTSLLIFVSSCKKSPPTPTVEYKKSKGVFICNEGNYTYGNTSLSFYDPNTKSIDNQVFYNANNFPLGDVCMFMTIKDTLGFLVINNSGKIIVLNTNTFKHIATITGLTSPRYVLIISNTKAYISDLYNTNITIFNPENFEITGSVNIRNNTESIAKFGNTVFATSWSYNNKVYKINTDTDKLTDSLTVTKQPNSIVLDKNNKLWVLSDGGFPGIPLAIMFPETQFTLIDSIGKKIKIVNEIIKTADLKNVIALQKRSNEFKEEFNFVTGRAVTAFPAFYSSVKHLIKKKNNRNGILYLKGGDFDEELKLFKKAKVYFIKNFFANESFETKKLIYIPK